MGRSGVLGMPACACEAASIDGEPASLHFVDSAVALCPSLIVSICLWHGVGLSVLSTACESRTTFYRCLVTQKVCLMLAKERLSIERRAVEAIDTAACFG